MVVGESSHQYRFCVHTVSGAGGTTTRIHCCMRFCLKNSLPNILIISGMSLFALVVQPTSVFAQPAFEVPAPTPIERADPAPAATPTPAPTEAALDAAAAAGGGVVPAVAAEAVAVDEETPVVQVGNEIYRYLFYFVITVFGQLFTWGGWIFDFGLKNFVLGFGDQYFNKNIGVAIEAVWTIVRDLFNLTFIFGLVYIGFKMILDSSDSRARSMLISLIGAALLVNFSLFIVKFVIDVANIAAGAIAQGLASDNGEILSVSNGFMNLIKFSTILDVKTEQMLAFADGQAFAYIFGLMLFLGVAAFVFAAGGILMIIRFVVLCLYMVFSPIMFIGWVFPAMAHHSKKYITGFLGNAFFAPAYMLMLYLSYKVLFEYSTKIVTSDYSRIFTEGPEKVTDANANLAIPFFVLTMVFLILSLVVAKNMGAVGASTAISIGNKLRGNIQGGITSAIGRNTVGRLAGGIGNINDNLEGSRTGRNFKRVLSVASLGALDERGRRNVIKSGKEAKFGGSYSRSDDKKFFNEVDATRAEGRLSKAISSGTSRKASTEDRIAFEQAITTATPSQLIDQLKSYDSDSPEYKQIVQAMSHSQVTKLLESKDEDLSPSKRAKLAKARGEQVIERLTSAPIGSAPGTTGASLQTAIERDATADDLAAMGLPTLRAEAIHITSAKMDDLKGKLSATEFGLLKADRDSKLETLFGVGTAGTKNPAVFKKVDGTSKKDSEIAQLPKKILMDNDSIPFLNSRVLDIGMQKEYIGPAERPLLRAKIMAIPRTTGPSNTNDMQDWLTGTSAGKTF